jgi:uncharacterized hydrophobic protein (TIGR00341 family)
VKLIEVMADAGSADTLKAVAEKFKAYDFRLGFTGPDGRQAMRMVVADESAQKVLDTLQNLLGAQPKARVSVFTIEAVIPKPEVDEQKRRQDAAVATREALYESVARGSQLDLNYLVLVVLSIVVAAIGLIENNVAVVIGAMVIAPLLGPLLAFGLGTALGDLDLMRKSFMTGIAGIGLAVALSVAVGYLWQGTLHSDELLARTNVGLDSAVLALASGAAAVLSLTTGLSTVLVGVMVAVALLPPAATLGLTLGEGRLDLAAGAGLLLAINIVCVNLAANVVFLLRGVRPRTWLEKEKARKATWISSLVWVITLTVLILLIYLRRRLMAV